MPVLFRPMPEPNTPWYAWSGTTNGNTPDEYVLAWKHVRKVVRQAAGPRVSFLWSPYVRSVPETTENAIDEYFPGSAVRRLRRRVRIQLRRHRRPDVGRPDDALPARVHGDPEAVLEAVLDHRDGLHRNGRQQDRVDRRRSARSRRRCRSCAASSGSTSPIRRATSASSGRRSRPRRRFSRGGASSDGNPSSATQCQPPQAAPDGPSRADTGGHQPVPAPGAPPAPAVAEAAGAAAEAEAARAAPILTLEMVDRLFWRAGFGPSQAIRSTWTGRTVAEAVDCAPRHPQGAPAGTAGHAERCGDRPTGRHQPARARVGRPHGVVDAIRSWSG